MEKAKKPWWVKLISAILGIVIFVALVLVGIWAFVKIKYDINLISTISQVKTLNTEVNASEKYPNMFSISDMESAKTTVNAKSEDLITGNETDGYTINSGSSLNALSGDLKLTDKEIGAIINNLMNEEGNSASIQIGSQSLKIELIQILFENVAEKSADVNIVIKLDTKPIKDSMSSFPLNMISKYIPDTLYVSSTVTVNKEEGEFKYNVTSKDITINNLSSEETRDLVKVLNIVLKCGSAEELCLSMGEPFINALIGNETNNGFAYSLNGLGAKDYDFAKEGETIYFVIKIAG